MFNGNIRELTELRYMNSVMPAVMCQYQLSVPFGRISRTNMQFLLQNNADQEFVQE